MWIMLNRQTERCSVNNSKEYIIVTEKSRDGKSLNIRWECRPAKRDTLYGVKATIKKGKDKIVRLMAPGHINIFNSKMKEIKEVVKKEVNEIIKNENKAIEIEKANEEKRQKVKAEIEAKRNAEKISE